jgi:hypothetical protein
MSWTAQDLQKKGYAQIDGGNYEPIKNHVAKKVEKIDTMLSTGNKKIKNATKIEVDGVNFDSKLEKYMYDLLRGAGIDFEFQKVYQLQEPFKYDGAHVRAINKIVDFYLPGKNMIIDTKGYSNDVSPMKHKMLKHVLKNNGLEMPIEMPKNKKECDVLLNKLLFTK